MEPATAAPRKYAGSAATASGRARLGMYVFLASDLMLFAPFFAAYYLLRTGVEAWPPTDVVLDTPRAAAATMALIASSATLVGADRAGEAGNLVSMRRWLLATIALGVAFLGNQLAEYTTLSFRASSGTYGSIYWLLTGLHSAHVTAGLGALSALAVRTVRADRPEALLAWAGSVSAFWHLVDVVWVGVFVTIWLVR